MNSRERNVKFLGLISLRKAFPVWAMPKGSCCLVATRTILKSTKIGWHVSALRYAACSSSKTGPTKVFIIRLNSLGSVSFVEPHAGQTPCSGSWSTRWRFLQSMQSVIRSENCSTCPDACQTCGWQMMVESNPTTLSLSSTIYFHQSCSTERLSGTPYGP